MSASAANLVISELIAISPTARMMDGLLFWTESASVCGHTQGNIAKRRFK